MKRVACIIIAFCICIPLFSACHGSKRMDPFVIPEVFDETKTYEITFWAKNDTNLTQVEIYHNTIAEFEKLYPNITFKGKESEYLKNIQKTPSGTVKTVSLCGNEIKGSELRKALDLNSSCFDIAYKDGAFKFTVYGYGHGVGMSQNGANYMAQQGAEFEEILCHYYTGCKIEEICE